MAKEELANSLADHFAKALEGKPKHELYEPVQELDIDGRSSMTKDELIDAIKAKL